MLVVILVLVVFGVDDDDRSDVYRCHVCRCGLSAFSLSSSPRVIVMVVIMVFVIIMVVAPSVSWWWLYSW